MSRNTVNGISRSELLPHDFREMILTVLKMFLGLVFAGWIFLWIIVPTSTWKYHWSPKLYSNTYSTYFGRQGTNILIYAFPILFIAVVGCIYLHFRQKNHYTGSRSGVLSSLLAGWKRPVLVQGPLGVVSGIEFTFVLMFLALLVWSFSMWEAKLDSVALRFGLVGNLCLAFLFFPVTRSSSLLQLIGLTSESCIKYHMWLGHIVMVLFSAHGVCYLIYWDHTSSMDEMKKWAKVGVANVAGEIALLAGLIMWITTFPRIRRKMFELFYYTHHFYILFLFFYMLHVGFSFFCMILPGFSYNPTSTIFINIPSVSKLQWHPFTVTSSSNLEPERLSVIIKKEGSWTQKLHAVLSSPADNDHISVSVEGPYSPISMNILRYESLVMVSGGSGITPFISIIRELIYQSNSLNTSTPEILLVCVFRNSLDLTVLDLLLPISSNVSDFSNLKLLIKAYVTKETEAPTNHEQRAIRTICFKPHPSDVPISPVLGSNSWLYLAVIISASFVAFLVLTGILQRYYIYPKDKNTFKIYSWSKRTLLHLLFMCVCIVVAATIPFLINKRSNSKAAKRINGLDIPTPTISPSSWLQNSEIELESLPRDSLIKATNVHYGRRPDLKKILLEINQKNVGVVASGPSGLRHEVAAICSSGLADNLHYESISFSW
ncbi:hypothetical protein LUZ61_010603 [Rhynchospora tenuis]|uniref:ferric-chelate reductase (NADH) n=1 Tax=Rhynchospora tenuis TaxID=198213 RepID=A0AAD5ZZW2_9POAL|nr:hypothetical protein LUZ61_010603 [Rhynchospora tenuis]